MTTDETTPTPSRENDHGRERPRRVGPGHLSESHRDHLHASGLDNETIQAARLYTEDNPRAIALLLSWSSWRQGGSVLVFDYIDPGTGQSVFKRVRPDKPRERKGNSPTAAAKLVKYEQPKGHPVYPYFTPRSIAENRYRDAARPLVITEGEKKGLLLDQLGFAALALPGVNNAHDVELRAKEDKYRLHPAILEHVTLAGRECIVCFDSDLTEKPQVEQAARVLAAMLYDAGAAKVLSCAIPNRDDGSKRGIDDFFVDAGEERTRAILAASPPLDPATVEDPAPLVTAARALKSAPIPADLRMPRGYFVDRTGQLWRESDSEESPAELVERGVILLRGELVDADSGEVRVDLTFPTRGEWRTAIVDRTAIADSRAAIAALAPCGAPIDSTTAGKVITWLRDFEDKNQRRLSVITCSTRCGWRKVSDADVFVLGDVAVAATGPTASIAFDSRSGRAQLGRALSTPAGTEAAHVAALAEAFKADRVAATAIVAAFSAPFIARLGAPNFAVHLAGDSSRGKSSMLKIAASIYGDPKSAEWVPSWNTTQVGLEVRAALACDLPLCIDEAGILDDEERRASVYNLIGGVGKSRGARQGGLRDTHAWRTIVISTGERPLADDRSDTGARARVLQFHVDGFGSLGAPDVDRIRGACEDNFGHAGRSWIQALAGFTDWPGLREDLRERTVEFQRMATNPVQARRAGFVALLSLVEEYVHERFGFGHADGETMAAWMTDKERGLSADEGDVTPLAERALDAAREWYMAQPGAFPWLVADAAGRLAPKGAGAGVGVREVHGYLHDEWIAFLPGALRDRLARVGVSGEVAVREWKRRGWLVLAGSDADGASARTTRYQRIGGSRLRLVTLRRDEFGDYLSESPAQFADTD